MNFLKILKTKYAFAKVINAKGLFIASTVINHLRIQIWKLVSILKGNAYKNHAKFFD